MPDGAWDGKDLFLLISILVSSACALYFGLTWAAERERDEHIKRMQKEWADRNDARRREREQSERRDDDFG